MANTTNYQLEKYDPNDSPDLTGKLNRDLDKIDAQLKANADNATALPASLQKLADKTASATHGTLSVDDLANIKLTDDGLLFVQKEQE